VIERIHVEGLHVQAHVGVSDAEREKAQTLVLNVTLVPRPRELRDNLNGAVDYAAVASAAARIVRGAHCKLIETIAENVAAELLAQFDICRATVEVRKFVLPNAEYVAVTSVGGGAR
jgi:7,8-dihydroneopterin aldolase/epimerase/oxygenase